MHEERVEFDNGNSAKLVGVFIMPNDHAPIVILSHGLGSSKDSGTHIGFQNGFAALGIGSLRFDFYGHGESDGKFENITLTEGMRDVEQAYYYLRNRFPHVKIGLVGSSFGGGAAFYVTPKLDIAGAALICPAIDIQKTKKKQLTAAKMNEWEKNGWVSYTTFAGQDKKLNFSFFEDAKEYTPATVKTKTPLLFVHGDKDTTVPYTLSQQASKALGATFIKIKDANHNFSGEGHKDTMMHAVINFFVELFSMNPEHTHGHQL